MYERFINEVIDELAEEDAAAYDDNLFVDEGSEEDRSEWDKFEEYLDLEFGDWDALKQESCRGFEIDSKNYIRWVQRSLNRNVGSLLPATGEISPEYRQAVKQFQIQRGITPTGDIDENTQNKLIKANESDPKYVVWVQRALNTHGYGLVVDGVMGSNTKKAISDFQQKRVPDLCVDGYVGAKTELRLIQAGWGCPPGYVPGSPPNYYPHLSEGISVPTGFLGRLKEDIKSGELRPETEEVLEDLGLFNEGIIDSDDRRRVPDTSKVPYRWICLLIIIFPDPDGPERSILFGKRGFGSGLLIGTQHILTAAHNLYNEFPRSDGTQVKLPARAVIAIPGHDSLLRPPGLFPFGAYFCSQRDNRPFFRIPHKWRQKLLPRYDFGLIKLDESIGRQRFPSLNGQPFGWWGSSDFGQGTYLAPHTPATRERFQELTITACGYPGDKLSIFGASQWLANGQVRNDLLENLISNYLDEIKDCEEIGGTAACREDRYIRFVRSSLREFECPEDLLAHTADMVAGQSGGAIWMKKEDPDGSVRRRLVAIATAANTLEPFNIGTLLTSRTSPTPGIFDQIRRWIWAL